MKYTKIIHISTLQALISCLKHGEWLIFKVISSYWESMVMYINGL